MCSEVRCTLNPLVFNRSPQVEASVALAGDIHLTGDLLTPTYHSFTNPTGQYQLL